MLLGSILCVAVTGSYLRISDAGEFSARWRAFYASIATIIACLFFYSSIEA